VNVAATAQALADDVLWPNAAATDRSEVLPRANLDALAAAGLYGLTGPRAFGGLEAEFVTACNVVEILASACLTTTFVWCQHLGTVPAVAAGPVADRDEWLAALCSGERRTGVVLPGRLHARPVDGGWVLSGTAPWLSGWGRIDYVHAAASAPDGCVVWALLDASETDRATPKRLELLAINASATVRWELLDVFVPTDRVTAVVPAGRSSGPEAYVQRTQAAYPLGITRRCCRLLGRTALDAELDACRNAVLRARPSEIPAARAAAASLALRAAAAVTVARGSRAVLAGDHAQRVAREAIVLLVYGGGMPVRDALLATFGAATEAPPHDEHDPPRTAAQRRG
jgi:alkylation response protein AidB-like acyl-CoA dehydrogenase